nr:MAG TPA: zinc finger protein [Bacteriophage sp.]
MAASDESLSIGFRSCRCGNLFGVSFRGLSWRRRGAPRLRAARAKTVDR